MAPRRNVTLPKPSVEAFEPDRFYAVDLARVVEWKGRPLYPGADAITLRGDVCEALRSDIAHARPV